MNYYQKLGLELFVEYACGPLPYLDEKVLEFLGHINFLRRDRHVLKVQSIRGIALFFVFVKEKNVYGIEKLLIEHGFPKPIPEVRDRDPTMPSYSFRISDKIYRVKFIMPTKAHPA